MKDGGGPPGDGLQDQFSNHPALLGDEIRCGGRSREEQTPGWTHYELSGGGGRIPEGRRSETTDATKGPDPDDLPGPIPTELPPKRTGVTAIASTRTELVETTPVDHHQVRKIKAGYDWLDDRSRAV